ncbi:hypothetical protein evm_013300 [Chilo suppressalis]|nr:hypothetical protein evm_013300 [Chilo suppressalis]
MITVINKFSTLISILQSHINLSSDKKLLLRLSFSMVVSEETQPTVEGDAAVSKKAAKKAAKAAEKQQKKADHKWSVIRWVTKNLLSRVPPCFGRPVKPLFPAALADPHWSRVVVHSPISLFHP